MALSDEETLTDAIATDEEAKDGVLVVLDKTCLLYTSVQDVHTGIDGAGKVCFLGADDLLAIGVMLAQLGVSGLAGLDDGLHQIPEERCV